MYLMFKYKNMMPHEFYALPYGEKLILSLFLQREINERNKENKEMFGG